MPDVSTALNYASISGYFLEREPVPAGAEHSEGDSEAKGTRDQGGNLCSGKGEASCTAQRPKRMSEEELAARRALFRECQAFLFEDSQPNVLR